MIPKSGGKFRRLGIATITDRVVQAILEAGARTDLGNGLLPVQLRVPSRTASP